MNIRIFPRTALLVGLVAAVAGCGPVKRINPPAATLQRLALHDDGSLALELRIQNHSDLSTRVGRFEGKISLDGRAPLGLAVPIELDVPSHAAEVIPARVDPAGWKPDAARTLRYRLTGRLTTTEPRGDYAVEYESTLSPVPGRPGEFR